MLRTKEVTVNLHESDKSPEAEQREAAKKIISILLRWYLFF